MKTKESSRCKGKGWVPAPTPSALREIRLGAGLSQRKLAARMGGLSAAYISDLERGNRNINPRVAEKWAQACGAARREAEMAAKVRKMSLNPDTVQFIPGQQDEEVIEPEPDGCPEGSGQ